MSTSGVHTYPASEEYVKVQGRTLFRDGVRYLGYSGSSISFTMRGSKAKVRLLSNPDKWGQDCYAWLGVFVDKETEPRRFCLEQSDAWYTLYEDEKEGIHTITLMKFSEAEYAVCGVSEIAVEGCLEQPPKPRARKIQSLGDSITCGYGMEGMLEELRFYTSQENPWHAYALQAAAELQADTHLVCWSGRGVYTNFLDEGMTEAQRDLLIPEQYQYTDVSTSMQVFGETKEQWELWDAAAYRPDLVTVFLGTNDASFCQEIPERNFLYIQAYVELLEDIHKKQPQAKILCMLGTMDQRLCASAKEAVSRFDSKIGGVAEYLQLPMQEEEDGLGTFWHPTYATQKKLTKIVVKKIRDYMGWHDEN